MSSIAGWRQPGKSRRSRFGGECCPNDSREFTSEEIWVEKLGKKQIVKVIAHYSCLKEVIVTSYS